MSTAAQTFCRALVRSRLLTLEEARAALRRWRSEAGGSDVNQFRRWLVQQQYLTRYQSRLLSRGHDDGFFLDEYKILDRLGKGRMAGVYKAADRLGQVVAVKVLPPSNARDPQMLGRFLRESRLALRLDHPNVVRTYQAAEARGLHYLVMEYLEGETLDVVLRLEGRLPAAEAARLVYQALLGLQHMHEQGLVHRDLKPGNLMLVPPCGQAGTTAHCTVKILDIGLGRAPSEGAAPPQGPEGQLTGEGALLGTPDYLAPEQARDARSADVRSDIYSLGCVLYHLLTGQPPFPDTNVINQMVRHATEAPRPVHQLEPLAPEGLQEVLDRMLAKEPALRFATPKEAAAALLPFVGVLAESAGRPVSSGPAPESVDWAARDFLPKTEPGSNPASGRPSQASAETPWPPAMGVRDTIEERIVGRMPWQKRMADVARDWSRRAKQAKAEAEKRLAPLQEGLRAGTFPPQLTRRDTLMFFLGVGATLLGLLIARIITGR